MVRCSFTYLWVSLFALDVSAADFMSPGRAVGLIPGFCVCQAAATGSPIASALNVRRPGFDAPRVIDGDTSDTAAWDGKGCPNWVQIELPRPIELARVIVHPGGLRYAPYPSTERSPRVFVVQGWLDGRWQAISAPVSVPRYAGQEKAYRVLVDIEPRKLRRFRLWITAIYDEGKRVHSPDKPVVPPEERSVIIREIEWLTAQQAGEPARAWRSWLRALDRGKSTPVGAALRQCYGPSLEAVAATVDARKLGAHSGQRRSLRKWLDPWKDCLANASPPVAAPWLGDAVGRIALEVDPGDTPHEFYPASVALDLAVVERALGYQVNPYAVQVLEVDPSSHKLVPFVPRRSGIAKFLCPSRFDRITPTKGTLRWTLRDRTHTRFVVQFLPRQPGPPPDTGRCTLGNCDLLYFDTVVEKSLPGNLWSAVMLDWDGDGRQDLIAGRWTDYCHLWRNVGSRQHVQFSEREHWLVIDESDEPIAAVTQYHGLAFSVVMPTDFDGDGRTDIFLSTYHGTRAPTFHRNLGPRSFPVVGRGRQPVGLAVGRAAFGDLNGDGKPDALVIDRETHGGWVADDTKKDDILFHAGAGLSDDGRPIFRKAQKLDVRAPRSHFVRSLTVPTLADTDADGALDLFLCASPDLWLHENVGTRSAFRFAEGIRVQRNGKPLEIGHRYPWIAWSDADGDGDLDLLKSVGARLYVNEGDANRLRLGKSLSLKTRGQKAVPRANLRAFAMVDWDGDGDLDHVLLSWGRMTLEVSEFQDGLFRRTFEVEVDPDKRGWYGCCAPREYYSLYGNVKLVDWDSDRDLDLFVTTEHSWRFGYIHYYENLGGHKFGPEVRLRPGATCDYVWS